MANHSEPHPMAGATVTIAKGPFKGWQYAIEDWWDRMSGGSWMFAQGNAACIAYAKRTGGYGDTPPWDDNVVYGKIGGLGKLIHTSEIQKEGEVTMATKQETALAVKGKVERRITMSAPLLERMGITVEQFQRVALDALVRAPALSDCTPDSLDLAVMNCIESGLLPDGKQAAIVPFKNVATLIPMVKGRLMLARQATPGLSLRVRAVFKDDEFEYEEGLYAKLKHKVNPTGSRTDQDLIATYAIAKVPGAIDPEFEVFYRADIDRARAYSKASSGPWQTHFIEMAKNAPMKMLLNRLPQAVTAPPEPPAQLDNWEFNGDVGVVDPYTTTIEGTGHYVKVPGEFTGGDVGFTIHKPGEPVVKMVIVYAATVGR